MLNRLQSTQLTLANVTEHSDTEDDDDHNAMDRACKGAGYAFMWPDEIGPKLFNPGGVPFYFYD